MIVPAVSRAVAAASDPAVVSAVMNMLMRRYVMWAVVCMLAVGITGMLGVRCARKGMLVPQLMLAVFLGAVFATFVCLAERMQYTLRNPESATMSYVYDLERSK